MRVNSQEIMRIDNYMRMMDRSTRDIPEEHYQLIHDAINLWIDGKRKYSDKISFTSLNSVVSFLRETGNCY